MSDAPKLRSLSKIQLYELRAARWMARTDLGWLCRNVLGYKDVSDNKGGPWRGLHQPIIDVLQKFPKPTASQFDDNDKPVYNSWDYKPLVPIEELLGKRKALILDPRGFLKTTINSVAHTIQWILNYPDIAILIFMSSDQKSADVLGEIKRHFQYNPRFRELFPEHCPQRGIGDWGRADRFISEARKKWVVRKEPTVMTGAIEKGAAGYHFEVIKFSDIVDENNISGEGLQRVLDKFDISHNLLVGSKYWIDVEGTRYHFADTYGKILERESKSSPDEREYNIHLRSVFKRNIPGGEKYNENDMKFPFLLDDNGKRIPWWPERWSLSTLERDERANAFLFACQKLNWPISSEEGQQHFPVNTRFPRKITKKDYVQNVRLAYKEITVDFGETDTKRADYTAIVVGAISEDGKLYIEEIIHGRFLPDIAVSKLLSVALKHYRHLKCIKFEKSSFQRGLMSTLYRELDTKYRPYGIDFNIELIQRGNRTTKIDRIAKALQPWYKNDDLRFVVDNTQEPFFNDLDKNEAWETLVKELQQFPASQHDDILDALSDFLSEKEYFGREKPRKVFSDKEIQEKFQKMQQAAFNRLLDIAPRRYDDSQFTEDEIVTPSADPWYRNFGIY